MKAKLDFGAEIDILSGDEFDRGIDRLGKVWREYATGLKHVRFPVMRGAVTAGGALTLGSTDSPDLTFVGPAQGYVWRVARVSVYGLTGTEEVELYFGDVGSSRFVRPLSASNPEWDTSRGLLLHPGDHLVVSGAGLTAGEVVSVNGEAYEAPAEQIFKLIGG